MKIVMKSIFYKPYGINLLLEPNKNINNNLFLLKKNQDIIMFCHEPSKIARLKK